MLTEEQLMELLKMQNIGGMEEGATNQMALADQMRASMQGIRQRNDVGSNLGRAGYGIAQAMGQAQGAKQLGGAAKGREGLMSGLLRAYQRKKSGADADPSAVDEWMQ